MSFGGDREAAIDFDIKTKGNGIVVDCIEGTAKESARLHSIGYPFLNQPG